MAGLARAVVIFGTIACGADPERIELRVWGEAFVEDGIAADEVVDGWAIVFDELTVSIGDIRIEADASVEVPGWYVVDLTIPTAGEGSTIAAFEVAGALDDLEYRITSPRGPVTGGNASPEQVDAMRELGLGMRVRGRATREDASVAFAWDFATDFMHRCALDQDAATPRPEGPTITLHADHLFLDDLELEPRIAFDALANADIDDDGSIGRDELAAVDIRAFERYQTGSRGIPDLWNYVGALAGTMGHVDGEGDCQPVFVPAEYRARAGDPPHAPSPESFATHCASCHGDDGSGNGTASDGWPAPADLRALPAAALDPDYLFYRIREGGAFFPYNSQMPALAVSDEATRALVGHVLDLNDP